MVLSANAGWESRSSPEPYRQAPRGLIRGGLSVGVLLFNLICDPRYIQIRPTLLIWAQRRSQAYALDPLGLWFGANLAGKTFYGQGRMSMKKKMVTLFSVLALGSSGLGVK